MQERAVGGGDDADIDLDALGAADALEAPLLEHTQQFRLHGRRHVADFVQEDRPLVRHLEAALALADRAGERAFLVAEQLAFQQRLGQCRTVDGDERPRAVLRRLVDRPSHLLLAGAGLALDQHSRVGVADVADQLEDGVHPRVLAQHVVEGKLGLQLGAQVGDLFLEVALPQSPLHDQSQIVDVDGLGQEVVGPQANRLHSVVDAAKRRHDDDRGRPAALLHGADQFHTVEAR